jgi:glucose-6-phosphate isomerase
MIKLDSSYALLNEDIDSYQKQVSKAHKDLHEKTGKGNDYLGWVNWPNDYNKDEFERMIKVAKNVSAKAEVLLVCGIGGSYLGARAAIEMVQGLYSDNKTEVIFVGNTFSSTYFNQVKKYIADKSVVLNVISKSGTTTETAMAFRMFKQLLEEKYGKEECKTRIIATTDKARGTLKELADKEGYQAFVIPDDIGGRYSVTTSVGLLPMAIMGIDIREVMNGAKAAFNDFNNDDLKTNVAYQYAVIRRIMGNSGKKSEMLISYEPNMGMFTEWWKQLFGESEGKDGKGLLPTSAIFSTDLHSLGQFVQDGDKILFETILNVEKPMIDSEFPMADVDQDSLNYLAGKSLNWVNKMAMQGTLEAHVNTGKVPNVILNIEDTSAYTFGYLTYFFFKACGMTCYLIDVNPFNQPGVEIYKKNMFKLLGKK